MAKAASKAAPKKAASKGSTPPKKAPEKSQAPAGAEQRPVTMQDETRSMQQARRGTTRNQAVVNPKGWKVPEPLSTPANTSGGDAQYGSPKEDYGGDQASNEGTYLGDVLSKPSENLP